MKTYKTFEEWWDFMALTAWNAVLESLPIESIVDELFTSGVIGDVDRLRLVGKNNEDGGGWCKQAVRDIIKKHLKEK